MIRLLAMFLAMTLAAAAADGGGGLGGDDKSSSEGFKSLSRDFTPDAKPEVSAEAEAARLAKQKAELAAQREAIAAKLRREAAEAKADVAPPPQRAATVKQSALTAERRQAVIEAYDRDGDGTLDPEEKAAVRARLHQRFQALLAEPKAP